MTKPRYFIKKRKQQGLAVGKVIKKTFIDTNITLKVKTSNQNQSRFWSFFKFVNNPGKNLYNNCHANTLHNV